MWQIKKYADPVELGFSHKERDVLSPLKSVNGVDNCLLPLTPESKTLFAEDICESTLKPLSLTTLVDFNEDLLSDYLEVGLDLNHKFTMGESILKELGFISPIKATTGSGTGYFLRSSSKLLLNTGSSGFKGLLTSINLNESELGTKQSDVIGTLRAVDARDKVIL